MTGSRLAAEKDAPVITLVCQPDSHHFDDRFILVNDEVKVGRSVGRIKASESNAIFDCKVLSRSHAIIQYRDRCFFLRDTRSSNGTFVNNTRLVSNPESSGDLQLFSGDFIKFGVDVVEQNITHGCISIQIFLYHPGGDEVTRAVSPNPLSAVDLTEFCKPEDVYRLTRSIDHVVHRESQLARKLESVNDFLSETRSAAENSWKAMLNEDRMLEKLRLCESKLSFFKAQIPEDSVKIQLLNVLDEKSNIEVATKGQIERLLKEKNEAVAQSLDMQLRLSDSETKYTQLQTQFDSTEGSYQLLIAEHQASSCQVNALENQLQLFSSNKIELETQVAEQIKKIKDLEEKLWYAVPSGGNIPTVPLNACSDPSFMKSPSDDNPVPRSQNGMCNGPVDHENVDSGELPDNSAFAELAALDDMLESEEKNFASSTHQPEPDDNSAANCLPIVANEVRLSLGLVKDLQAQLSQVIQLTPESDVESTSSVSSMSIKESDENGEQGELLTQSVNFFDQLSRAIHLTSRIANCHIRAHNVLNPRLSPYSSQEPTGDNGSSDPIPLQSLSPLVSSTTPASAAFSVQPTLDSPCKSESNESPSLLLDSTNPAGVSPIKLDNAIAQLEDKLRISVEEIETYKQLITTLTQKDISRNNLLKSVREECDSLRSRIAEIESQFAASREDHQRLTVEARRTRIEADALAAERDALQLRIASQFSQMEELRDSLSQSICNSNPVSPTSTSVLSESMLLVDAKRNSQSHSSPISHALLPSFSSSNSSMSLLFVIPLMVLLCGLMIAIFTRFSS